MNHPFDLLQSNLLDLLYELHATEIRLIVGGGYGLYLKHRMIEKTDAASLLSFIPAARSTDDLDLFLGTQILVDKARAQTVLEAMQALKCEVVKDRENFQFFKDFNHEGRSYRIKFDFLTKMPNEASQAKQLSVQRVRVRNKKKGGIHAHLTEEAIAVEESPIPIELEGFRTTGDAYRDVVYLPQAYAYLMMKLFAFRDWEMTKKHPGFASKHALDLYAIVAMMTEEELIMAEKSSQKYRQMPAAQEAAGIVNAFFAQNTAMGNVRLREHQNFSRDVDIAEFLSVLTDLFPL